MATIIHGIAASENIDSSGERLLIKGMDISSLTVDGVFNYEHKSDLPSQIVGKVLLAKKIYSEKDCDTPEELYFWKTIETPYIYVKGELFDDYKESAKDVAGMFDYDHQHRENDRPVMNFSIEGHKIEKKGIEVVRSIARKVTITVTPCNKAAIAEKYVDPTPVNNQLGNIFKTENMTEIALFIEKAPKAAISPEIHASILGIEPLKKAEEKQKTDKKEDMEKEEGAEKQVGAIKPPQPPKDHGYKIGTTSTGRDIHSHKQVHEYGLMSPTEHREAASMHDKLATSSPDLGSGSHHKQKAMLHLGAAHTAARREERLNRHKTDKLMKAMDAGSAMAAPSQLTQGAALSKEELSKKKKKRLKKADEIYKTWEKREEFVEFMQKRLPNLTKFEIDAIGRALAIKIKK